MLGTFHEGGQAILPTFVDYLRAELGVERAAAFGWTVGDVFPSLAFWHTSRFPVSGLAFKRGFEEWIQATSGRWSLYDPVRPEPFQRNVVMPVGTFASLVEHGRGGTMNVDRLTTDRERREHTLKNLAKGEAIHQRHGLVNHHQTRVLVCDGPLALAWVGVFHPEPLTQRQLQLFRRIAPALKFRLIAESRMESAPLYRAGMEAALEAISQAAFLVSREGRVLHANSIGRAAMSRSLQQVLEGVRSALAGAPGYSVSPLALRGAAGAFLVVARAASSSRDRRSDDEGLRQVSARFGLTRRQGQVLRGLVRGRTNRRIADQLGCSERTVEIHVTKLLRKMNAATRAEAVARAIE